MLKVLAGISGLAVGAGFLGGVHPLGDSLAVFRVPLLVIFALAVIWTNWGRWIRWPLAGVSMGLLVPHAWAPLHGGAEPVEGIVLYQQNLLFDRVDKDAWLSHVRASGADVVTLQEVSLNNRALLEALSKDFPYQHLCPLGVNLGEAVLSRFPVIDGSQRCSTPDGFAAMQVLTDLGLVWLVSVHFRWPWPYGQAKQVAKVAPQLAALDGPVIVAGDFNAVAWSHTVAQVGRSARAKRAGSYMHTFNLPWGGMPIGIDHVLAPKGWDGSTQVQPKLGADHRGVLAQLRAPGSDIAN